MPLNSIIVQKSKRYCIKQCNESVQNNMSIKDQKGGIKTYVDIVPRNTAVTTFSCARLRLPSYHYHPIHNAVLAMIIFLVFFVFLLFISNFMLRHTGFSAMSSMLR